MKKIINYESLVLKIIFCQRALLIELLNARNGILIYYRLTTKIVSFQCRINNVVTLKYVKRCNIVCAYSDMIIYRIIVQSGQWKQKQKHLNLQFLKIHLRTVVVFIYRRAVVIEKDLIFFQTRCVHRRYTRIDRACVFFPRPFLRQINSTFFQLALQIRNIDKIPNIPFRLTWFWMQLLFALRTKMEISRAKWISIEIAVLPVCKHPACISRQYVERDDKLFQNNISFGGK